MKTPSFTIVLIARNEEKTLPRLIASLKEFQNRGGDIIVVDTGSSDQTARVAHSLGCRVEEVGDRFLEKIDADLADKINERFVVDGEDPVVQAGDTLFNFSAARNYAASLSKTNFIFMPDCDEVYTNLDINRIEQEINNGVEQFEYPFIFAHDQFGNPTIRFTHSKAYDRTKLTWVGIIHEVLKGDAHRLYVDESVIKLEHFQNTETNRKGYLKGLAWAAYHDGGAGESPDRASHYFGREMFYTGRFKSAIKELKRHIEMNGWAAERASSAMFIGDSYKFLGDNESALMWYFKAYCFEPTLRGPLMKIAHHYFQEGNAQAVATFATAALEIPDAYFYANDAADHTYRPHEYLYWAKWQLGDKEASKDHFFKAWSYLPEHKKFLDAAKWYGLPTVSIIIPSLGREEGLRKCLKSIEKLNYPKELIDIKIYDGEEGTVPEKVAKGVAETTGEYICYAANDIEFTPNSLLIAVLHSLDKEKALVAFNTNSGRPDYEGTQCEHFIIARNILPLINGEIFCTEMFHVGVDQLLWAQMSKINQAMKAREAIVQHNHFTVGAEFDDVYKRAWNEERVEHDRALLKKKLDELESNN